MCLIYIFSDVYKADFGLLNNSNVRACASCALAIIWPWTINISGFFTKLKSYIYTRKKILFLSYFSFVIFTAKKENIFKSYNYSDVYLYFKKNEKERMNKWNYFGHGIVILILEPASVVLQLNFKTLFDINSKIMHECCT